MIANYVPIVFTDCVINSDCIFYLMLFYFFRSRIESLSARRPARLATTSRRVAHAWVREPHKLLFISYSTYQVLDSRVVISSFQTCWLWM